MYVPLLRPETMPSCCKMDDTMIDETGNFVRSGGSAQCGNAPRTGMDVDVPPSSHFYTGHIERNRVLERHALQSDKLECDRRLRPMLKALTCHGEPQSVRSTAESAQSHTTPTPTCRTSRYRYAWELDRKSSQRRFRNKSKPQHDGQEGRKMSKGRAAGGGWPVSGGMIGCRMAIDDAARRGACARR
jgi:hypothetical protein